MLARNTFLALIPKPYYRTSIQRHIRCCSVLQAHQGKQENQFQFLEKWKRRRLALEDKFRNKFPRTADVVFLVRDGITGFLTDTKDMILLQHRVLRETGKVHDLSLRELEILHEFRSHVMKMFPIIIIFAIPLFGNFIVAFLAYSKPVRFLSPHFWTNKQKLIHAKEEHKNRLFVFLPIIKYLKTNSPQLTKSGIKLQSVLMSVQEGRVPDFRELTTCKELFSGNQIFSLEKLSDPQLNNLLTLHRRKGLVFKTFYLEEWGTYLKLVDQCIKRNGGVSKLTSEQLRKYCYQRGVNASAMTEKEMCNYLNQWIAFSEQISNDSVSLLLHAPAIIGFSHKSNLTVTDDS